MGTFVSVFTREETGAKYLLNDTELQFGLSSVYHSTLETGFLSLEMFSTYAHFYYFLPIIDLS